MHEQRSKRATLILADISGYTGLLSSVGTAHHEQPEMGEALVATTGWPAYALLSAAAVSYLDISTDVGSALESEYAHSGPMNALVIPLGANG